MKASKVVFLVFLIILSICVSSIQPVKPQSSGIIYIRSDGSVEGTDKIQREGDVYTFASDIGTDVGSNGIVIERDNIVLDGSGYTLKGILSLFSTIVGVTLKDRSNVTVENINIQECSVGFEISNSSNCIISENSINPYEFGIQIRDSNKNRSDVVDSSCEFASIVCLKSSHYMLMCT